MLLNTKIPVVIPSVTEHWKKGEHHSGVLCVSYSWPLIWHIVREEDTERGIPRLLCYRTILFLFLQERLLLLSPEKKEETSKTWMS